MKNNSTYGNFRVRLLLTLVTVALYYLLFFIMDSKASAHSDNDLPSSFLLEVVIAFVECFIFVNLSFLYVRLLQRTMILRKRSFDRLLLHDILLFILNIATAYFFTLFEMMIYQMTEQDVDQNLFVFSILVTFVSGIYTNYRMMQAANDAELKRAELEIQMLKMQIDPHFMFNNFSILTELIEEEPKVAVRFLNQLSKIYRYVISNSKKDVVSVKEEMEFLSSYIFLISIRYERGVQITVDSHLYDVQGDMPPVCLQLLVENAIKHNSYDETNLLHINIRLVNDNIVIENDFRPLRSKVLSTGVGINNILSRYAAISTKKPCFEQVNDKFSVTLPII